MFNGFSKLRRSHVTSPHIRIGHKNTKECTQIANNKTAKTLNLVGSFAMLPVSPKMLKKSCFVFLEGKESKKDGKEADASKQKTNK